MTTRPVKPVPTVILLLLGLTLIVVIVVALNKPDSAPRAGANVASSTTQSEDYSAEELEFTAHSYCEDAIHDQVGQDADVSGYFDATQVNLINDEYQVTTEVQFGSRPTMIFVCILKYDGHLNFTVTSVTPIG